MEQFTKDKPIIFWADIPEATGKAQGGYFLRNTLKDFFEKLEGEGKKIVGIKFDGSYNLEILVEAPLTEEDYMDLK